MKKGKVLFLITAVMITLVIAGCGVVVDVPITPATATGTIRICTNSPSIYGSLYVDNSYWDEIDGAGVVGKNCLS
ncbi:MAG: hypothetical protein GX428_06800 [Candidatus Atribacteria bacterium]|nr:hypothetical protein [Candidatus Atribacteria bacterium]